MAQSQTIDNILAIPEKYKTPFSEIILMNTPPFSDETLAGSNIAALTPINDNGLIDKEAFLNYYRRFIKEAGVRGLLIAGGTGEGESVTNEQYQSLLECTDILKDEFGIKIIAGALSERGKGIIKRVGFLEAQTKTHSIDYIMLTPPLDPSLSNDTFTPDDMINLLREISEITSKPLVLYRTKLSNIDVSLDTLLEIHKETKSRLKVVKDTTPIKEALFSNYSESKKAQLAFELGQGNDNLFYEAFDSLFDLGRNYVGNISGGCNILPIAQIRQILVASLRMAHAEGIETGKKEEYLKLARDSQDYISEFYGRVLRANMPLIGPDELKGRREPILLKGFANIISNGSFPTLKVDGRLMSYPDRLETPYIASLVEASNMRNHFLNRYVTLTPNN